MKSKLGAALALAFGLFLSSAPAQDAMKKFDFTRYVPSGIKRNLGFYTYINPECSVIDGTEVKMTQGPEHGTVEIVPEENFGSWAKDTVHYKCNEKRIRGFSLYYKSSEGYHGPDRFNVLILYPNGSAYEEHFTVNVRGEVASKPVEEPPPEVKPVLAPNANLKDRKCGIVNPPNDDNWKPGYLNVREKPDPKSNILRKLEARVILSIAGEEQEWVYTDSVYSDDWGRLLTEDRSSQPYKGWVARKYLIIMDCPGSSSAVTAPPEPIRPQVIPPAAAPPPPRPTPEILSVPLEQYEKPTGCPKWLGISC
jgi:hypothetical protein